VKSGISFARHRFRLAQLLHPLLPRLALALVDPGRSRIEHRCENRPRIPDQAERDVAILADRAVVHVDLHQRRHADPLAIAHAEVERRADDDDDIRLGEGERARPVEMMGGARG
jgi:hypothetical protein